MLCPTRTIGRLLVFGAVLTAGALTAADADAFCRSTTCVGVCGRDVDPDQCKTEGAKLFWPSACVGFSMQRDASEFVDLETARDIVQKAFVAWSDIECADGGYATIAFSSTADVVRHVAEYNEEGPNANIIMFQDTKWVYQGIDNTLAKTTVTYDTETGEIFDADIELNHAFNEFTTGDENVEYDLQSITTHEVGHFIGLDHTTDFLATMNAGYQRGSIDLRAIEPDDEDAACAAYPPDRGVPCATQPKGGFDPEYNGPETEEEGCSIAARPTDERDTRRSWGFALLTAALVWLRRRKKGSRTAVGG